MTFSELNNEIRKARREILFHELDRFGFEVQIEMSIDTYHRLSVENGAIVRSEAIEKTKQGLVFGIPFILTQDTDRVLIAKSANT